MKIIIPNAKELNTNLDNKPFQTLSAQSQAILEVLDSLSLEDLASFYKLSPAKAELEADRWARIGSGQAKAYPAWQLYDGLMYRYMERRDLSEQEMAYLDQHVRLATAFYGLISPFERISPHRLDFQGSLKIGHQSLKQYWRPFYDEGVADEEVILSLASSEFEQVFSPQIQKRLRKVIFMEEVDGQYKTHSTISKKGRGRMLSWMAKQGIQDLVDLQAFSSDGFRYCSDKSTDSLLTFVRPAENVKK